MTFSAVIPPFFVLSHNASLFVICEGEKNTNNILKAVEGVDIYEPASVRAFLQNSAFENMIGGILYEGIFEFLQKVDIIGNIVNSLPLIGPMRQAIVKEFKNTMDRTLGG